MKSSWIRHFRSSGQTAPALALGLLLASYASENGTGVRVSHMALATMLGGCSERTLSRNLNGLLKKGWIARAMIGDTESLRLAMPKRSQGTHN